MAYNDNDRVEDLPLVSLDDLVAGSYIRCYHPVFGEVRVDATTIPLLRGTSPIALLGKSEGDVTSRTSVNGAGDATSANLDSCTIPGGTMGPDSRILISSTWTYPNSGATKTVGARLNTTSLGQSAPTTSLTTTVQNQFWNLNSLSVQRATNGTSWNNISSANSLISMTFDTTDDQTVNFACNWSGATNNETIVLAGWFVLMLY